MRYDFEATHGPGSMDHSRANVRRYSNLRLSRLAGVPSHLLVDGETRELFVADTVRRTELWNTPPSAQPSPSP